MSEQYECTRVHFGKGMLVAGCSMLLSIGAELILSLVVQTYAVALTFLLLAIKCALLSRKHK